MYEQMNKIHSECLTFERLQEEEEEDDDDEDRPAGVYRRLVFLLNESVVQSEVRGRDDK